MAAMSGRRATICNYCHLFLWCLRWSNGTLGPDCDHWILDQIVIVFHSLDPVAYVLDLNTSVLLWTFYSPATKRNQTMRLQLTLVVAHIRISYGTVAKFIG